MQAALQKEWVELADRLADAAGDVARRYFRAPLTIDRKDDASPVTQADREVESAMRALIEKHCPDHGIFGEEHGKSNEQAEYQWVLDPIDGTRAFIAGYPLFTTLIALVKNGTPILGVIDQPILKDRWRGAAQEKTVWNGKPAATKNTKSLAQAMVCTTSAPFYFSAAQAAAFERVRAACANTLIGGDAYGYAMLASGHIDLFIDASLKPYDFCALVPVIEGAGGVITDWKGAPLTLSSKGDVIAAANRELHKEALTLLRP